MKGELAFLANWFEFEVRPRLKGRCTLIRFADDAVLAFEDIPPPLSTHAQPCLMGQSLVRPLGHIQRRVAAEEKRPLL
jgi:hypothetical protein